MRHLSSALLLIIAATFANAEPAPLRIAVASNFQDTFAALTNAYGKRAHEQIDASYGATGTLYDQIMGGAPFVAFFAADDQRTAQLVDAKRARPASRFIYAIGHLVLWAPGAPTPPDPTWLADNTHHIAIADPKLAPYGLAAQQTLTKLSLWDAVQSRLVVGNSIAQTLETVASGKAAGGFVADAQLIAHFHAAPPEGQVWHIPETLHAPIIQEAVALNTPDAARAEAFFAFIASDEGRAIIEAAGYSVLAPVKPAAP
jgi:molybdate transport system substrate-binding protein